MNGPANILSQVKDIPIVFTIDGAQKILSPKEDMSGYEAIKIMSIVIASLHGANIDAEYYVKLNNLERHFD